MTEQQRVNIDIRKLFNLGANLLVAAFIKQKPDNAKKLFKELKQGKRISAGQLTAGETGFKLPVKLELERSEFRGQFNFPNFEICLKSLLHQFQIKLRQDKELKQLGTLTNQDTGGILFKIAGPAQIGEDLNMLMMAIEPGKNELLVRLMFMDPEQFRKPAETPADAAE